MPSTNNLLTAMIPRPSHPISNDIGTSLRKSAKTCSHPNFFLFRSIGLIFCFAALHVNPALANTYYVWSDRGGNRNSGLTWEAAWQSLTHAERSVKPGDTVIIRKSQKPYRYIKITRSGFESRPITYRGESPDDPPVLVGADKIDIWQHHDIENVYWAPVAKAPTLVIKDDVGLSRATSPACIDGNWHWDNGRLYYRTTSGEPSTHEIWYQSHGGGIQIGKYSWIVIEDIKCWIGGGACIQISGGSHNTIRRVHSKWNWRGVDVTAGSNHNLLENIYAEQGREGVYIRNGSSYNTLRNCLVTHVGNAPLWTKNDRHAVAVGEKGGTIGNIVEGCEIAYSGGIPDSAALSCFRSPGTVFRNNHVHDNHATGLAVYSLSPGALVEGNRVTRNGKTAVQAGMKGITGLTVRNSKNVKVIRNRIEDNHVSPDSPWPKHYRGAHGGLDIDSSSQRTPSDMSGLHLEDNIVTGTIGGPDIQISKRPNLSGIVVIPRDQAPRWLIRRLPSIAEDQNPAPR